MKTLILALPLALSAAFLTAAPAAADDRRCTGAIGAQHVDGSVVVPKGATCTLNGTRVDGNVLVRAKGELVARGVKAATSRPRTTAGWS